MYIFNIQNNIPDFSVGKKIINACGAVDENIIGRGNRSTQIKHTPLSLRPRQVPHDLTWDLAQDAEMGC
jgi:hypothetical protein